MTELQENRWDGRLDHVGSHVHTNEQVEGLRSTDGLVGSGGTSVDFVGHSAITVDQVVIDYQAPNSWDGVIDVPTLSGFGTVLGVSLIASCVADPGATFREQGGVVVFSPSEGTRVKVPWSTDSNDGGGAANVSRGLRYENDFAGFLAAMAGLRLRLLVTGSIAVVTDPFLA